MTTTSHDPRGCSDAILSSVFRRIAARLNVAIRIVNSTASAFRDQLDVAMHSAGGDDVPAVNDPRTYPAKYHSIISWRTAPSTSRVATARRYPPTSRTAEPHM